MFRVFAFLALLALACPPARADTVVRNALLIPMGYCQLSVTAAVLISTCSGGIPAGATITYLTPETAAIRWRDDATAPTTTVGNPVSAGQQLTYYGLLSTLQVVAQAGAATVNINFYRY
jgi:hypothetical protein